MSAAQRIKHHQAGPMAPGASDEVSLAPASYYNYAPDSPFNNLAHTVGFHEDHGKYRRSFSEDRIAQAGRDYAALQQHSALRYEHSPVLPAGEHPYRGYKEGVQSVQAWSTVHHNSVEMLKAQAEERVPLHRAHTEAAVSAAGQQLIELDQACSMYNRSYTFSPALPAGGEHPYEGHDEDQAKLEEWSQKHQESVAMLKAQSVQRVPLARQAAEAQMAQAGRLLVHAEAAYPHPTMGLVLTPTGAAALGQQPSHCFGFHWYPGCTQMQRTERAKIPSVNHGCPKARPIPDRDPACLHLY